MFFAPNMVSKLLIYWSNCCSCFCQIFVFVLCLGLEANVQRVLLGDSLDFIYSSNIISRPAKKANSYEKKSHPLGVQVSVILCRLSIIKLKVCKCSSNVANCRLLAAEKIFVSFWPFKPGLPTVWTEICWWDIVCCLNNFWLLAAKFSMSLKSRQKTGQICQFPEEDNFTYLRQLVNWKLITRSVDGELVSLIAVGNKRQDVATHPTT